MSPKCPLQNIGEIKKKTMQIKKRAKLNAYQVRQYIQDSAKDILDEGLARIGTDIDPITGEPWEGNIAFWKHHDALLRWADKAGDAPPKLEPGDSELEQLAQLKKMVLDGVVDAQHAENMLKPMLAFMDLEAKIIVAEEIQDLEDTIGRTQIIFNVNNAKAEIEVTYGEGSKYDTDTQQESTHLPE